MERKPKIAILRWEQGITPPAFRSEEHTSELQSQR